jgi:hypothetical protein
MEKTMGQTTTNESTATEKPSRRTKAAGQGDIPAATNCGTGRAPNNINGKLEPEQAHAEPNPAPHVAPHEDGWSKDDFTGSQLAVEDEEEIEREENEGGGQHG